MDDALLVDFVDGLEHLLPVHTDRAEGREVGLVLATLVQTLQERSEVDLTHLLDDGDKVVADLMVVHLGHKLLVLQSVQQLHLVREDLHVVDLAGLDKHLLDRIARAVGTHAVVHPRRASLTDLLDDRKRFPSNVQRSQRVEQGDKLLVVGVNWAICCWS